MKLFGCSGCAAKDQTIAMLREQLEIERSRVDVANVRTEKAHEAALAVADKQAHLAMYRRPRNLTPVEAVDGATGLTDPYTAMSSVPLPLGNAIGKDFPKTQEDLEEMIDAKSGRIPPVVGAVDIKPVES